MTKEEMKLLFVNPCIRRNAPTKILPVGLASVMTFVKENGYECDLLDVDIHEYEDDWVEDYIKKHKYDVILYGSIVTHYKWIKWFTKTIKRHHPDTKVIVGNSVAGSVYELFLQNAPADIVVIGEGEYSALESLEAIRLNKDLHSVEGIAFRNNGQITKTKTRKACNIDELPMVDWDGFDVQRYLKKGSHYMSFLSRGRDGEEDKQTVSMPVTTARGCTFRCTFCHFVFWNDPFRHRAPDKIVAEIRRNIERYGANYIAFWDDLSFATIAQVEELCDAIMASGLKFDWMATIRSDLFGKPHQHYPYERRYRAAQRMKEAGCLSVGFALESANEKILEMMNKKVKRQYFIDQVKMLREIGIVCNTTVVFGYPIETKETIKETFDTALETGLYPSIGFLMPLPYTGMYTHAKEHGYITDEDKYLDSITERQDICLNMTKMSDDEIMEEIKVGCRRLNDALQLGLAEDKLIRSGGAKPRTNLKQFRKEMPLDPDNIKRNEGDLSFNYSATVFKVDAGDA